MLVTAGTKEKFNTMTASWGGTGVLWGKTVAFIFIRPERYTYEFIKKCDTLTLSFLGEENKAIHKVCGSKSGRDTDKIAETGLKPVLTEKAISLSGRHVLHWNVESFMKMISNPKTLSINPLTENGMVTDTATTTK